MNVVDENRNQTPIASPASPPKTPVNNPSSRKIRQILERSVPMAIKVPISRVRSKALIMTVLATLSTTMTEITAPRNPKMPL